MAVAPGEVVTNRHVIEDGVSWRLKQGNNTWPATISHLDPDYDLCQLNATGLAAPPVPVRSSATLAVGDRVYAIGSPEGLELTLSEGLISGLREFEKARLIQTSAAISPGSSGGGLFDVQGRLIGITTFYLKEGQNLNFALPGEWLLALAAHPVSPVENNKIPGPASPTLSWFELGLQLMDDGKYEKAVSAFHEVVRLDANDTAAWIDLGITYGHLHQYDQAIRAHQQAIRLTPEDAVAWNNLGNTYGDLRQYDQATHAHQEAVRLKPDYASAWNNLGIDYGDLHQYDQAIRAHQEAVRLKPDYANAWNNLGDAYFGLNQFDPAIHAYQEAIRLEPDYANAWMNLGNAYLVLSMYDQAIRANQEAVRLKPEDAYAWNNLGASYALQGDRTKVLQVYEKLKQINPEVADKFFRKFVLP